MGEENVKPALSHDFPPGLSHDWTPHQAVRRQPLPSVSSRAKEAFLEGPWLHPFSPGVCFLSSFFQQEASCNPEASMRSKPHVSLFTSLSAEPTSSLLTHSTRFVSSDLKGSLELFFLKLSFMWGKLEISGHTLDQDQGLCQRTSRPGESLQC